MIINRKGVVLLSLSLGLMIVAAFTLGFERVSGVAVGGPGNICLYSDDAQACGLALRCAETDNGHDIFEAGKITVPSLTPPVEKDVCINNFTGVKEWRCGHGPDEPVALFQDETCPQGFICSNLVPDPTNTFTAAACI